MNPARSRDVFEEKVSAEEAFETFTKETYGKIVNTVRLVVRDTATAQDVVQEAFARAYINWSKLWPDGNPAGWTYRVATNLAINWRRRATREVKAVARLSKRDDLIVEGPEAYPELHAAVKSLPVRQRMAVGLHYVLGLSMEQAAEAMKCRPGTVKSLLFSARERLRKELGDE